MRMTPAFVSMLAVMSAVLSPVSRPSSMAVIGKLADVCPASITTVAGTVAAVVSLLLRVMVIGWLAGLVGWFYPALALPAVLLGRQVVTLDIDDPGLCLRLFKANREAGLAVAVAILAGWG